MALQGTPYGLLLTLTREFNVETLVLTEVVTPVDVVSKSTSRIFTEAVVLVSTITSVLTALRTFTETIVVEDIISKQGGKLLAESVTLVDTLIKDTSKVFTETVTLVSTLVNQASKVLSETIVLVATMTTIQVFGRMLTETITITATFIAGFLNYVRRTPFIGGSKSSAGGQVGGKTDIGSTGTRYE